MEGLEQKLSYRFRDRKLLDEALSHSSYGNEHRGSGTRWPRSWSLEST